MESNLDMHKNIFNYNLRRQKEARKGVGCEFTQSKLHQWRTMMKEVKHIDLEFDI